MSSLTLEVRGTAEAVAAARARYEARKERIRQACQEFGIEQQSYVREQKLSGNPLHQRSGDLSNSIHSTVEESPRGFAVFVFSLGGREGRLVVPYAKVHEFGGTFTIPEHERRVAAPSALVGKPKVRGFKAVTVQTVREHTATYPERSFLRSSQLERANVFIERMRYVTVSPA